MTRMRRLIFPLALLMAFWPSGAAFAQRTPCPDYVEPEITVTPVFTEPLLDHAQSIKEIEALRAQTASSPRKDISGGLTSFDIGLHGEAQNLIFEKAAGHVCVQVSKYDLTMIVKKSVVLIAAELPDDSCGYGAILEHEKKHVLAVRKVFDEVLPLTERHIREFLRHLGVVKAKTREDAEAYINQAFHAYVSELNASLLSVCDDMGRGVDTEEEYQSLEKACGGELAAAINKASAEATNAPAVDLPSEGN